MSQLPMNHFDDEQLVDAYYGEFDPAPHFAACEECRGRFERLRDVLDSFNQIPIPERDATYSASVWARLVPKLSVEPPRRRWLQWWSFARPLRRCW